MRAPLYEAAKINLQRSRFYAASLLRSTRRTHPHGNNQRRARNVSLGLIRGPKIHSRGRSVCSVVDGGLRWEGEARPGGLDGFENSQQEVLLNATELVIVRSEDIR